VVNGLKLLLGKIHLNYGSFQSNAVLQESYKFSLNELAEKCKAFYHSYFHADLGESSNNVKQKNA